ncbi:hypothetical protein [Pedomonas sp. V897]|uniref:hypothetical protein n=1 Tax=Pedomonas sp. V897 TaxID=3446482 RepID=UPI003EE2DCC3
MATPILAEIESVLRETGIAPSRFGRTVMGDPRLVFDLRRGRCLTPANVQRVRIALHQLAAGA